MRAVVQQVARVQTRHDVSRAETGRFGGMVDVNLVNDGPFTLWLDTDKL